jgi:hypothetical protein
MISSTATTSTHKAVVWNSGSVIRASLQEDLMTTPPML